MSAAAKNYPIKIKQIPRNRRPGKITKDRPHKRESHEEATARAVALFGYDLQFLYARNAVHVTTPDCLWRNEYWEMKSPEKNNSKKIVRTVRDALPQSQNVILDISRCGRSIEQAASDLIGYIRSKPRTKIKKVLIIDKENYCIVEKNEVSL